MAHSMIESVDPAAAKAQVFRLRAQMLGDSPVRHRYTTGKRGTGRGQQVLVLGGTGYIGHALVPELAARGYTPVVLTRKPETSGDFPDAKVVVGDAVKIDDLKRVFDEYDIEAVISLLSSRMPNDVDECRRVDYEAVSNAIELASEHGVKQFVHISDYGVYRPELLPQIFKLQVEGELIGGHHGDINWTIIRPTAYYPYLSINFGDVKNGEPYRIFDHGEYNIVNPIAREDLSEFITNVLFDPQEYGRILPVGGPWVRDNVCTLRSAGEMMFEVLGREPNIVVETMASWDKKIRRMRRMALVYPKMRSVVFYLEAAKYWSVVNHVAPPYGERTLKGFFEKLKDREYPAGSFRQRMKSGTELTPTDV